MRAFLALAAILVLASSAFGATSQTTKFTKQVGGSTGDSLIVAADTSTAIRLPSVYTGLAVFAASDSNMSNTVQISPDNSSWFIVSFDSTVSTATSKKARATADLGTLYGGMWMRTITDNLTAAGAPYGASWIIITK